SRRNGRIPRVDRCVMSRPSKMIFPPVGSSNRVSIRPVVVFPQPDSPTRPRVSPADTSKSRPSTACTAATWWRKTIPRITGKCLISPDTDSRTSPPGAGAVAVGATDGSGALTRPPRWGSQAWSHLLGPDPAPHLGREMAGDQVTGRRLPQRRHEGLRGAVGE